MPTTPLDLPLFGLDDRDPYLLKPGYCPNLRNVRTHRERIDRGPGTVLFAATPTPGTNPGFGVRTGTFTANTATGTQVVTHSLGVAPKAIILWTNGSAAINTTYDSTGYTFGMGFTDLTTSRSVAVASQDAVSAANASRRYANKLLTVVQWGETTLAECDYSSSTTSTFTVNWTTAFSSAAIIHWMVIGAAAINAKVLEWTLATSAGSQAVTGVGFTPQVGLNACSFLTAASSAADSYLSLGAAASGSQWAIANRNKDAASATKVDEFMSTSATLAQMNTNSSDTAFKASLTSMDADGFTFNKDIAPGSAYLVATLFLNGLSGVKVGSFTKNTTSAPFDQAVTGVGFEPQGLLTVTTGMATANEPAFSHNGFFLGATDGTSQSAASHWDADDASTTYSFRRSSDDHLYWAFREPTGAVMNSAKFKSFDSGGFTFTHDVSTGTARSHYYVAFKGVSAGTVDAAGTPRNYTQPQFVGTQKNIMLTDRSAWIYNTSTTVFDSTTEAYAVDTTKRWAIINTQDKMIWTRLGINLRSYDGTTFAAHVTAGTDHSAKALIAFNDRPISIYTQESATNYPTRIRWPKKTGITDYATTAGLGGGLLEIVETSNKPLTGGFVLGERAYLTKNREIIELLATGHLAPVFRQETRIFGTGMIATHSAAAAEFAVFFLGPDDVYQFDGNDIQSLGTRNGGGSIYMTLLGLIDYTTVVDQAQGAVQTADNEYWLLVPPYVFIYDYRRERWFRDDYANVKAIGVFEVGDSLTTDVNQSSFLMFGLADGRTGRVDPTVATHLGDDIDSYVETRDYGSSDLAVVRGAPTAIPSMDKMNSVYAFRFQTAASAAVDLAYSTDQGTTWSAETTVTANSNGVGTYWIRAPFSRIRFRLRERSGGTFQLSYRFEMDWQLAGRQTPTM